jgi:exosortase B
MSASFAERNTWRESGAEWLPVLLGLLLLYGPVFYDLANGVWQVADYAHGPIILAAVVWLIWDKRSLLVVASGSTSPIQGVVLLTIGLIMYVLGRSQHINLFEIGSIVPVFAGVLIAMRGWQALRAYWFMLIFAVYLIPLPEFFVDAVTGPLKKSVSEIAEQILYSAGYPIARSGVELTIGQYQLLVADACSGINSMFSLSAIGMLYLYLMRYKSWLHNSVILASLLPIAFCANVVRVVFLVLVTYHFGDAAGQGFVHKFSGMVLFVVALITLLLLDAVLVRVFKWLGRGA